MFWGTPARSDPGGPTSAASLPGTALALGTAGATSPTRRKPGSVGDLASGGRATTSTRAAQKLGSSSSTTALSLRFRGNAVFLPEVYRAVLYYAGWEQVQGDHQTRMKWLEETIQDFLIESGYELASVTVIREPRHYEVFIDEGRLDKIIFINVDPWMTVQLIFLLDLPKRVFNRDLLERRLERVREKMSVEDVQYEVVPVEDPQHQRFQISNPDIIEGLTLLRPGEPHELRISLTRSPRQPGLDVGLGFQPPDGLVGEVDYLSRSFLAEEDRLEVFGRLGIRLTEVGRVSGNRLGLSQAGAGFMWSSPSVLDHVRFAARTEASLEARRREDLSIANYFFSPVRIALGLTFEWDNLFLGFGGGLEPRFFFETTLEEDVTEPPPILDITEGDSLRSFVGGAVKVEFNPRRLRRDRPHRIELEGRHLWPVSGAEGNILELQAEYLNTITVGFDEFRYRLKAAWLDGGVPFYSELAMGDGFLRSAFQGTVFVREAAALALEYRISLSRDTLKLSFFNDIAVFDGLDELRRSEGIQAIENPGVGLHILLVDAFQVDGYIGVGIQSNGQADVGFSLNVSQAF